jgi:hypothetical protein
LTSAFEPKGKPKPKVVIYDPTHGFPRHVVDLTDDAELERMHEQVRAELRRRGVAPTDANEEAIR